MEALARQGQPESAGNEREPQGEGLTSQRLRLRTDRRMHTAEVGGTIEEHATVPSPTKKVLPPNVGPVLHQDVFERVTQGRGHARQPRDVLVGQGPDLQPPTA